MTITHRHSQFLKQKLQVFLQTRNAVGLASALTMLSVADFRVAGTLLADDLLLQLSSDEYWTFFLTVVPTNSKAYLGTFLKAARKLYAKQQLKLQEAPLKEFAEVATVIDKRKLLEALLPIVCRVDEAMLLIRIFSSWQIESAGSYLLNAHTPVTYYLLFQLLKMADSRPDILRHYVILLIRKGGNLSFNLASIICHYFDLQDVPGRFSLSLQPYELGRLDQGFQSFEAMLKR